MLSVSHVSSLGAFSAAGAAAAVPPHFGARAAGRRPAGDVTDPPPLQAELGQCLQHLVQFLQAHRPQDASAIALRFEAFLRNCFERHGCDESQAGLLQSRGLPSLRAFDAGLANADIPTRAKVNEILLLASELDRDMESAIAALCAAQCRLAKSAGGDIAEVWQRRGRVLWDAVRTPVKVHFDHPAAWDDLHNWHALYEENQCWLEGWFWNQLAPEFGQERFRRSYVPPLNGSLDPELAQAERTLILALCQYRARAAVNPRELQRGPSARMREALGLAVRITDAIRADNLQFVRAYCALLGAAMGAAELRPHAESSLLEALRLLSPDSPGLSTSRAGDVLRESVMRLLNQASAVAPPEPRLIALTQPLIAAKLKFDFAARLHEALRDGATDAVARLGRQLLQCLDDPQIEPYVKDDVGRMLCAFNAAGEPGITFGVKNGHGDAVRAYFAILRNPRIAPLVNGELAELMAAGFGIARRMPGLFRSGR
jgi:hypothetical protein